MIAPLSLPEAFQMGSLHVPRRGPSAPVELATPSISFANACGVKKCPSPAAACEVALREVSGALIPVFYLHFFVLLALGALLFPHYLSHWAQVLAPVWMLGVGMHALGKDTLGLVHGLALCLLYPCLLLSPRDTALQAFYAVFFGVFASGPLHREQRGVGLVAGVLGWVALLASVAWLLSGDAQALSACGACGLLLALVGSRGAARLQYKVVQPAAQGQPVL